MAIATATDPRLNSDAQSEYMPIPVSSLRLDTVTNFDLYLRARPGEPAVLYADRNVPFTEASRKRLSENQVVNLFVDSSQQNAYRRYLESNLQDILADSGIPLSEKSTMVHTCAQGVVKDIVDDAQVSDGVQRTEEVVASTVDYLFGQRTALRSLIETASFDYDVYTHSVNVSVMGIALAHRMGFKPQRLAEFGLGAMLRDVGMSRIDDTIRNNTGKLTVAEFESMKAHTQLSEDILSDAKNLPEITQSVIRHHHEKLDGSGYPDGLMGGEIPDLVRVCTVVDVFDALTTRRTHQKAMTTFDALQLMNQEMRGEIDADVLKAFISMMGTR